MVIFVIDVQNKCDGDSELIDEQLDKDKAVTWLT